MAHQRDQGGTAGAGIEPLTTVRVASGLNFPVYAAHAPDDFTRLFIIEKPGRIRILNLDTGTLNGTAFLDINSIVGGGNTLDDERGLLGLAFHPDYQSNGFFFVNYTNNSSNTIIRRYTVSANPDIANAASAVQVLSINQPQDNHNGGWMGFGPNDGYLYIATGDGGNFCDTGPGHSSGGNAQDITNNLLGKILRIIPSTTPLVGGYTIPVDNPFVGITGDDEIWAYGLRNPWRNSFDRVSGDLYIGDVGQDAREEIDYQPASSTGGENYGWRCMEGNGCSSASGCVTTGCTCGDAALTDPIHDYTHSPPPPPAGFVCSVTGGYVYRGCAIPTLDGTYYLADFCGGAIWSFKVISGHVTEFTDRTPELTLSSDGFVVNQIASFGEDARGEQYIVDQGSGTSGQVFKIVPASITDCNDNGVADACDIASNTSTDANGNGIPDECEFPADIAGPLGPGFPDGCVDAIDLAVLLNAWCSAAGDPDPPGDLDPPCEGCTSPNFALADIAGAARVPDGCVDAFDLAKLLAEWCSVAGGNPCGTCFP